MARQAEADYEHEERDLAKGASPDAMLAVIRELLRYPCWDALGNSETGAQYDADYHAAWKQATKWIEECR